MTREPFFAIDVASEIRSLCGAQLRGTWQMPAELVRFAIRSGARDVAVTRGWRGFSVSWKNGRIRGMALENLAVALDDQAEPARRQQSIADLEGSGAEALLWAGGVAGARLRIDCSIVGRRVRLTRRASRPTRLSRSTSSRQSDEVVVRWGCSRLDRRRAELWLRMACRFSAAAVSIDGRPVARGFAGGLYRIRLEDPLRCTLGLTRHGEEPVLWLLREGIVAARAVLPGYPSFEAAVELGSVVSGAASTSDLRRAVQPYVSEMCERAVDMMIEVAGRPRGISGPEGQRLVSLLLRAARRDLRVQEILSLPLIQTLSLADRALSVSQLEGRARQRGRGFFAVEPGEGAEGVLADPATVVVASPEVRNLLVELTGVRFQPPPRRRISFVRRIAAGARKSTRRAIERWRGIAGLRVVTSDNLGPGEVRLLAILRAALSPRTVELGRAGRLLRTTTGFVLPRADPAVAAAVRCVEDDPDWLYPLVLALRLDAPSFGSLRKNWTRSVEEQTDVTPMTPSSAGRETPDEP